MKKAILFDLDNTLYEYEPVHKKAVDAVYRIFSKKVKISKNKFIELYKMSNEEIKYELAGTASAHNRILYFQRIVEKTHNTIEPKIILQMYSEYWKVFLDNMKLKKGVLETLKKLQKSKIKIALVTNLTTKIQLKKMQKLKIEKYVDYFVTSEESGGEKPNSIMFLLTLNKLNLLPSEVVMVGDNLVADIEGANSVGIDSIAITSKKIKANKEDYKKPNYVIKNIPEILNIIRV
ncbi:MAG: HAD family hydrolase [Nanoarchaeota archaeon]